MEEYLGMKWRLGWAAIFFFVAAAFILLAELIISIIKGNSAPQRLAAEDPK